MTMSTVMHQIKRRLARAAVFFLVGVLAMLPVAANAAPAVAAGEQEPMQLRSADSADSGSNTANAADHDQGRSEDDEGHEDESKDDKGDKDESKDDKDDKGDKDESKDKGDEDKSKDDKKDESKDNGDKDESKDKGDKDDKGDEDKSKDDKKDESKDARDVEDSRVGVNVIVFDDDDVVTLGPAGIVPAAVVPTQGGLGGGPTSVVVPAPVTPPAAPPVGFSSVDVEALPSHLGAAIAMFDDEILYDEAAVSSETTEVERGVISGSVVRSLSPVLPPALTDVVASPVVVIEALIKAMASSGQALVIPFLAGAAGFFTPGLRRRRDLLTEALGENRSDRDV